MKIPCKIVLPAACLFLLAGCASNVPNVDASHQFWENKQQTVAIAKTPKSEEKADFYSEGDEGLLGLALTNLANMDTRKILSGFNTEAVLKSARKQFIAALRQKDIHAKVVGTVDPDKLQDSHMPPAQYALKDYRQLSTRFGKDKLLTLTIDQLGEVHRYAIVVSQTPPQAVCEISGRLVDLKNNRILWRHKSTFITNIDKPYDKPENLYAALQYAAQNTVSELIANFTKNAKQ